jgi:hypothetical protein
MCPAWLRAGFLDPRHLGRTRFMETGQPSSLQLPSFLHGSFMSVARKTSREGQRCGEQYRKDGSFPAPRELLAVPSGEVVITHEVADFQREQPAWRLYMVSRVMSGLLEALDYQNTFQVRDAYEEFCLGTAWGALHFTVEQNAPRSAGRTALCLKAVLRFWEPLQSVRYVFKRLGTMLTLEELMLASSDWAVNGWCPVDDSPVRARLALAAQRMERATKEDCMEAILREMPRALAYARDLKHREVLSTPSFWREQLEVLPPGAFERVSGACTSDLLGQLYAWDRALGKQ